MQNVYQDLTKISEISLALASSHQEWQDLTKIAKILLSYDFESS